MQDIIEELIRWLGYFGLRAVTIGRYSGGTEKDRLVEGASGLALIALMTYLAIRFAG